MKMVDMVNDGKKETSPEISPVADSSPKYPYGLAISLGNDELEKLSLEPDCEVGDMIHVMAMAKVTSISKYDTENGSNCRIELQITHLGLEDESKEEEPAGRTINYRGFYKH